jgi:hypothetical protein
MTEMQSTEWWLALPEAMLSMNRQVHSTTGKSPYEVVFKQLMPDRPRISTAQRSTAIVLEHQESLDTIAPSIDPQLLATSTNSVDSQSRNQSISVEQTQAIQSLNEEVIANIERKVSAMEKRYNKVNKVEVFEEGDLVRLKIPVEDRCSTDNKRIFCRVVEVRHGNRYALQCEYGILRGLYRTKNMDRVAATIPHQIPTFRKDSHRELTLREAAHLQSPAQLIQVRCGCKGNCTTIRCKCFKSKVECTLHCHGRDGGEQCTNTGVTAVPSGTFNLKRNPSIPGPRQNHKRLRANTQGEDWAQINSTSTDKNDSVENTESDLTELDSDEAEGFEEDEVTGAEEEEEEEEEENVEEEDEVEEDEDVEDDVEEEGNENEETVSNEDMEHSVIVVARRL